ncbi:MAG TPA: mechanosensitive ion channel family protein [Candidatus Lokiarchaeia archaeon]|nr:mechanosensitive ion channel family protein [Candidatus Lokiarchaeia archaeon]
MKKGTIAGYIFLSIVIVLVVWYYVFQGSVVLAGIIAPSLMTAIFVIAALVVFYMVASRASKFAILRSKGTEGEAKMIRSVLKFAILLIIIIMIVVLWGDLGAVGGLFALFGGSMLGWSLQAPISGIAAWLMVSIVRPFRVGDRVQLPQYGLVGDVVSISPLYTTLNQVGGSVGSEEPADRTILVPNAMLFSSLIINYTPKHQDELVALRSCAPEPPRAYMLDEFLLRITFDSDWDEAEKILLDAARAITVDIIKETKQEPYIRGDYSDWYGPFLRLRFLTNATERPKIMYEISKAVFKAIQKSDKVDMAIPYVYSFRKGGEYFGQFNGENGKKPGPDQDPLPDAPGTRTPGDD